MNSRKSAPCEQDSQEGIKCYGGATRSDDANKLDFEAFLCPATLKRYAEHLHRYRLLPDGSVRDGDNWQGGVSKDRWIKSLLRHTIDVWLIHRGHDAWHEDRGVDLEDSLCAVLFNAFGYLHTLITHGEPTASKNDIWQ